MARACCAPQSTRNAEAIEVGIIDILGEGRASREQLEITIPIYEFECEECGARFEELVAAGGRGGRLSGLRVGADAAADLERLAARAAAARRRGALGRIAAAGARSGARRTGSPSRASGGRRGRSRERRRTPRQRREQLVELYKEVSNCTKCPLHETRTKTVFGAGNADADLMFVGEAPGAEEDRQGLPFVGRAGQLLNQLLEEIGLSREDVFIANVLKSRPPGNRDPQPLEIEACEPYLFEQVRLIEPQVVCTLGNFATKLLTGSPTGITKVRGTPQVHELGGRTVFLLPLLHPAAALRTPAMKEHAARRLRDDPGAARRPPPAPTPSAEEIAAAEGRRGGERPPRAARRPARHVRLTRLESDRDRIRRRPRPKRSAPASPSASRPATWSSSPARSGPARRR